VGLNVGSGKTLSVAGTLVVTGAASTINATSVGASTPSTGAFTTLAASSTVSGTGFSTYLASPPAIGGTTPAAGAFTGVNTPNTFGFKNRIINGDMRIDQRNAGASVTLTTSSTFPVDRWQAFEESDGVMTAQRVADAPTGFLNSLKFTTTTADGSLTGAERVYALQTIEAQNMVDLAWGTASAKAITLSFWVKSSLTGTFGGSLRGTLIYPFSFTISTANTWEQKTINIAGPTTGSWPTDNTGFINVTFGMGIGPSLSGGGGAWTSSNYIAPSGAVAVIGTLNATFQVTGVQFETGSTATSFDVRPFSTELTLCQRYFEKSYNVDTAPGAASNYQGTAKIQGVSDTSSNASVTVSFKVPKRTTATMTFYNAGSGASGTWEYTRSGAGAYVTANADQPSYGGVNVYGAVGGSGYLPVVWFGHWLASAEL
jgi:hypothetical protein